MGRLLHAITNHLPLVRNDDAAPVRNDGEVKGKGKPKFGKKTGGKNQRG